MKKICVIFSIIFSLFSCQEYRKEKNRAAYPPEKLFKNVQLQAAKQMFEGDLDAFSKTILKHPEVINELSSINGYTLLMYASIIANLNAMEILLKNGADPDIIIPYGNALPLNHAVGINDYNMLRLLLQYKVNLNPAVGSNPLHAAMMLGVERKERKMIDFLLEHGADINHTAYLGQNTMESAARGDLNTALYFFSKGGNPRIKGTDLSPMAIYMQWQEGKYKKAIRQNEVYIKKFTAVMDILKNKFGVVFPVKKDLKAEAALRIKLYGALNERDKRSVNFNKNYGINRYEKDKIIVNE